MYSATFIYDAGTYDDKFHALNNLIQEVAEASAGFEGSESWKSISSDRISSTYYWSDQAALKQFAMHPKHLEAKRQYAKWYKGYHVVIAKIERSYGDAAFAHITPNNRKTNIQTN